MTETTAQHPSDWFFCGIGGSGMLPLALILHGRGHRVQGSDRTLDQGGTADKFEFLRNRGIDLFPQDGSGLVSADQTLVTSTAIEDTVADVVRARELGSQEMRRAELLANLFNDAAINIGIAGTSGKSTVTGMAGWILHAAGREPTIMNGAVMNNFAGRDSPFASAVVGGPNLFVSEVDESDGSIDLYTPRIAVLTNITEDHKSLAELWELFEAYANRAETVVLNLEDPETRLLSSRMPNERKITFGVETDEADLVASNLEPASDGISFVLNDRRSGEALDIALRVPGRHNVSNALAAVAAAVATGLPIESAAAHLATYAGLRRRLERVGTVDRDGGTISVIDDFAHNPDKISATLETLHAFPGRLLVLFQPHGFGPLRNMRHGFIETFATGLAPEDVLLMPEPVYFGGTVNRDISSHDITEAIVARDRHAEAKDTRDACGFRLLELAAPGDRIVIMGARDDSLALFARDLLKNLSH